MGELRGRQPTAPRAPGLGGPSVLPARYATATPKPVIPPEWFSDDHAAQMTTTPRRTVPSPRVMGTSRPGGPEPSLHWRLRLPREFDGKAPKKASAATSAGTQTVDTSRGVQTSGRVSKVQQWKRRQRREQLRARRAATEALLTLLPPGSAPRTRKKLEVEQEVDAASVVTVAGTSEADVDPEEEEAEEVAHVTEGQECGEDDPDGSEACRQAGFEALKEHLLASADSWLTGSGAGYQIADELRVALRVPATQLAEMREELESLRAAEADRVEAIERLASEVEAARTEAAEAAQHAGG